MFSVQKIQDGLFRVVGIRQPFDPAMQYLLPDITQSDSGMFLDDVSGFDLNAVRNTQSFYDISDADFNTFLEQSQKSAISDVCSAVFNTSGYIDRNLLYSKTSSRVNEEINLPAGYVGYKIEVNNEKNIGFEITRVRLEYKHTGTDFDVDLYLFNSFNSTPIQQQTVSITGSDMVVDLRWKVDSTDGDYKGEYYLLTSFDSGLITPYKRDYENSDVQNYIKNLCFERITIPVAVSGVIFDPELVDSTDVNTGINPDITVFYDYTDLIIQNRLMFANAVKYRWAINLMLLAVNSMRSNQDERRMKEIQALIIAQVYGRSSDSGQFIKGHDHVYGKVISGLIEEVDRLKDGYGVSEDDIITMTEE